MNAAAFPGRLQPRPHADEQLAVRAAARTHAARRHCGEIRRRRHRSEPRPEPILPTMTDTAAETLPATDPWNQQLDQLRGRYRHARPAVLVALNILLGNPDIAEADAKAHAELHGFRITAASLGAARVLLARMDPVPPAAVAVSSTKPARKTRPVEPTNDAEALVRTFVAKLQTQRNGEADRLRDAIRKAVALLQAAIGNAP